jgi:hypothetical protein
MIAVDIKWLLTESSFEVAIPLSHRSFSDRLKQEMQHVRVDRNNTICQRRMNTGRMHT